MLQLIRATSDEHFEKARALIDEMARWDAEVSKGLGLDGAAVVGFFYPTEDALQRESTPPEGVLLLATWGNIPAGCGSFHRIDDNICELQNVYVRNEHRGRRIGRAIVEELIGMAAGAGYRQMWLETATFMKEAQRLYASIGFTPRGLYRDVPDVFVPWTLCMELTLPIRHEI
jgi:ribosomal protein S18 acetylase RimI-like enzyme